MNISYEEIGQVVVTCQVAEGVTLGDVVKVNAAGEMAPCMAGDRICGQVLSIAEDGCGGVQMKGFATLACGDTGVAPGWVSLVADGDGGVKKAASGETGGELLVLRIGDNQAVVCL